MMRIPVDLGKDSYDIILLEGALSRASEFADLKRKSPTAEFLLSIMRKWRSSAKNR